jgi:hypothetical protein
MMETQDLELLAARVEQIVDDLKSLRLTNKELAAEKRQLEGKVASLEKQVRQSDKEGDRVKDLVAQNKEYKKKCSLLQSKVTSMLAKVEILQ